MVILPNADNSQLQKGLWYKYVGFDVILKKREISTVANPEYFGYRPV